MMSKSRISTLLALALGLISITSARTKVLHWCFESSDVWHTDRDDYVSNNYLKPDWLSA